MNQDNQRGAVKRRIVKSDVGELDDRQMVLMDASKPEPTASGRRSAKVNSDNPTLGSAPAAASAEADEGSRAQPKVGVSELKAMRVEFAQELRELHKAFSNDIRTSHQELSNELRAQQLAATGLFKSGLSSIVKRLDAVLALAEHSKRVASVTLEVASPWWSWSRGGRPLAIAAIVAAFGLVLFVGIELIK